MKENHNFRGNNLSQPYIFTIKCHWDANSNQLLIKIIWIKQNKSFQQIKKISLEILKYILHALTFFLELNQVEFNDQIYSCLLCSNRK